MREYVVTHRGPGWEDSFAEPLCRPEELIWSPDTWMFQTSERNMVALVEVGGTPLVLKRFFRTTFLDRLESLVVGCRARRVADNIERLQRAGFATPELVAVMEETPRMAGGKSCAVTRPVEGGVRVDVLWSELPRAGRLHFANCLGSYYRRLHESGVYAQDTRVKNVLAVPSGGGWEMVLVDLDRVRVYSKMSWRRRLKNLLQVEYSLRARSRWSERLTFLRAYLGPVDRAKLIRRAKEILAARKSKNV